MSEKVRKEKSISKDWCVATAAAAVAATTSLCLILIIAYLSTIIKFLLFLYIYFATSKP